MRRQPLRMRLDGRGLLEVVDPGYDTLPLLQEVQPEYRIQQSPLDVREPTFLRARQLPCGLSAATLVDKPEESLWAAHGEALDQMRAGASPSSAGPGEATLLALKKELARRVLGDCRLCAHRCRVDRTRGAAGICRLGPEAVVAEHFVHISEEPPVNPSLVLSLAGCGLRCRYCQQGALLDPGTVSGEPLAPPLWTELESEGARTLSFIGGNPDESLYAILSFLEAAPAGWRLPVVWNTHAYATAEALSLLDGVVDVYLPDLKYGSDACARRWSAAPGYVEAAREAVSVMVEQGALVIVRILVLPGHAVCCHEPTLAYLATLPTERLRVSVRGQYCPDWRIGPRDGAMARRPTNEEVDAVRKQAADLGLRLVDGGQRP